MKIAKVVGSNDIYEYMDKFNLTMNEKIKMEQFEKKPLSSFINDHNRSRISEEALDLLDKMLKVDHTQRITAKEALAHPYFQTRYKSASKNRSDVKTHVVVKPKALFKARHTSPQPWCNNEEKAKMKLT